MKITLQQNKWHGEEPVDIFLPDDWDVMHETMLCDKKEPLDYKAIREKIENPIGCEPLSEMAKGKKRVCILFDDMSRPTPTQAIAEPILDILLESGVKKENIIFIAALGNHGPLTREDFVKKLGEEIVSEYFVYNHVSYDNLVKVGTAKRGFDVMVNKEVMECDLRIGIGAMIPHAANGFSGGYKIIFPGVAGIDTMTQIHSYAGQTMTEEMKKGKFSFPMGKLLDQGMRFEIEECGKMVGNLFKIDCFVNTKSEVIEIFAGDPIEEYYEAAKVCKEQYEIEKPEKVDVVIVNSNFKSNESNVSYGVALQCFMGEDNRNGDIVLVNFAKAGQVPHFMIGHFGRTTKARLNTSLPDFRLEGKSIYYSPYGDKSGMDEIGIAPDRYIWAKTWNEVMEALSKHGAGTKALVIDEGAIVSFKE